MLKINDLKTISLDEINSYASLMERRSSKFLIDKRKLQEILSNRSDWLVLSINGKIEADYTSVYFDTSIYSCFLDHNKGRRRRYKIRIRHYSNTNLTFLELKRKASRGLTIKERWLIENNFKLVDLDFTPIHNKLIQAKFTNIYQNLIDTIIVKYSRTTLFHPESNTRITIDSNISFTNNFDKRVLIDDFCILEIKAHPNVYTVDRILYRFGIRPVLGLSKYCLGILSLNPDLKKGRFAKAYRMLFDSNF